MAPAMQDLLLRRPVQLVGWLLVAVLFALVVVAPTTLTQQLTLSAGVFLLAWIFNAVRGRFATLVLMFLSVCISSRYVFWRVTETMFLHSPLDLVLGIGLLAAEVYAFAVLVLGYLQTAWPLGRKPVPLEGPPETWPTVDLFIPTYDEPLSLVRATVLAAQSIDWPQGRLHIHVLDDGRRADFKEFCAEAGVHYLTRTDNKHAKAGNLNAALARTSGEFIAIFDCDHVPSRSFLQIAMGWFQRDARLSLVQLPHHFYSPDPFARNLRTFKKVPNEGELFYGLIQEGNDLWNAAIFCGSCAVLRRSACEAIGGIAVETVTEDAHTALRLHRAGFSSAYLALPQAAGVATERLSAHVGQRMRWARGMTQIFRVDNPLAGPGLTWTQRLCYLNAMLHFLYGLPRLIYLTAPLAYLFLGASVIQASAAMIFAFALPHVMHANLTNSRVQGRFRYLLWNEVYEAVLAWYLLKPTLAALINPEKGRFNVTAKGGIVEKSHFDTHVARASLALLALNVAGAAAGLWRLTWVDADNLATVWLNLAWTAYNLMILGACVAAANENRQLRRAPRVELVMPATLYLPDGNGVRCDTEDFSATGLALSTPVESVAQLGTCVSVALFAGDEEFRFSARVVASKGRRLGLLLDEMTLAQERAFTLCTMSRADLWSRDWGTYPRVSVLRVLANILQISAQGFWQMGAHFAAAGYGWLRASTSRAPSEYRRAPRREPSDAVRQPATTPALGESRAVWAVGAAGADPAALSSAHRAPDRAPLQFTAERRV